MYNKFFFKKRNKVFVQDIYKALKIKKKITENYIINDIKDLSLAEEQDISFLHSSKYKDLACNSKCKTIITLEKFSKLLPKEKNLVIVDNVLLNLAKVVSFFYPDSLNDNFDDKCSKPNKKKYKYVKFGKNVLVGKNVKIGKKSFIGHNTIIESNVVIGNNCNIGSNVILKKTVIGDNVTILDGAVIGKKGYGFLSSWKKNIRYPHIGVVVIGDNVEIGCNNTIDRGSISNTTIGNNTFLDNQVHIAHNIRIGKNCIITAQVGFAGSSVIGDRVSIGGQAGISGHLKIGNNVQIGGGSGVIKNIPDNTKVMGYPAKDIRSFLKENR